MSKEDISWQLIPLASPHWGGIWESGIKCVKHHLKRTMGNTTLIYEELYTLLTEIEGILNSRSLCAVGDTQDDIDYLTPSHFLIGSHMHSIAASNVFDVPVNRLSAYRQLTHIKQCFWKKWSREYLSTLQQRQSGVP